MIKKNTKIIIEGEDNSAIKALEGGIPLSKGEIVKIHEGSGVINYKVTGKDIDCFLEGEAQIVNITYTLKRVKD